jgi:3-dehydrosphinganine reductase
LGPPSGKMIPSGVVSEPDALVAVISGGSSGIGLEIARILARKGYRLALLARDAEKLADAARSLAGDGPTPLILPLDVTDAEASAAAIHAVLARWGRIDWLVTSAGQVEPGLFVDLPPEAFRRQMAVNYFGTLHLVQPVVEVMRRQRSGRITLIASAAAFVGIAGYAAYTPGKCAVRGLAECLRVELAPFGISVSLALPPDTKTPQLAAELPLRPDITRRIAAGGGVLSAVTVARAIVAGGLAGRFQITPGWLMTLYGLFHSLYAPIFRRRQIRIARALSGEQDP